MPPNCSRPGEPANFSRSFYFISSTIRFLSPLGRPCRYVGHRPCINAPCASAAALTAQRSAWSRCRRILVRLPSCTITDKIGARSTSAALAAVANGALPFHFGGAQSSPYLLKIDFNVPSASSVPSATFIFSSNSRFPFRTANAALGLGDADWYVSTTRAP